MTMMAAAPAASVLAVSTTLQAAPTEMLPLPLGSQIMVRCVFAACAQAYQPFDPHLAVELHDGPAVDGVPIVDCIISAPGTMVADENACREAAGRHLRKPDCCRDAVPPIAICTLALLVYPVFVSARYNSQADLLYMQNLYSSHFPILQ